ncbi:MAG TPA: hypothetical protein VFO05_04135 [Candidatus Limnocylindrales bacterium]|nr:hypothetical protein [Candidatus Limnocylindrales bacterium]
MRLRTGVVSIVALVVVACGPAAPAALPLGEEALVKYAEIVGSGYGPATDLAVTALAVRNGTVAELEAGGFDIDEDERNLTPVYVDARFENRGTETISRQLRPGMENQDGDLINAVTILNFGGEPYANCMDNSTDEDLAPGDSFETCTLFFLQPGETAARVSFLPIDPGNDVDWVYWNTK